MRGYMFEVDGKICGDQGFRFRINSPGFWSEGSGFTFLD